jgi:hypothetical protein
MVTACGADSAVTPPVSDAEASLNATTTSVVGTTPPTAVTPPDTTVPVATTATPEGPVVFGTATHGAGTIGPLPGSQGMLGSGCTPGSDRLPDGAWFGWVVDVEASEMTFDLACLQPGEPPTVTNVNPQLRELVVARNASVRIADGSAVSVRGWSPQADPMWVFVNEGMATEVAYPTIRVSVDAGEWAVADVALPITGGCCGTMPRGRRSPTDPWPASGMPADGVYDVSTTADAAAGDVVLTIRRLIPCADRPELCIPDYEEGDLGVDYDEAIVRRVEYDDNLTVRILGIRPETGSSIVGATGVEGSGQALLALIDQMEVAFAAWIQPQLDAGVDYNEIFDDLMARGAVAPDFPYGSSDGYGAGAGPLAYRGPHGVLLVEWLIGPPNLLASATQLEVSNGQPILYIDAGQIAG